jgi:hypothetical protein
VCVILYFFYCPCRCSVMDKALRMQWKRRLAVNSCADRRQQVVLHLGSWARGLLRYEHVNCYSVVAVNMIGPGLRYCEHGNEPSCSINMDNF